METYKNENGYVVCVAHEWTDPYLDNPLSDPANWIIVYDPISDFCGWAYVGPSSKLIDSPWRLAWSPPPCDEA